MICTLDKVIFENHDEGFVIASMKTKDEAVPTEARNKFTRGDNLIRFTAVGYRLPTSGAIEVDLDGSWEKNKYGLQLSVERCVELIPKTKEGITAYLSSGLIKGIGEKTAKEIVGTFGVKTLEIIEKEPKKLLEIKGITEQKLQAITSTYNQSKSIRDIVSYLAPFGITVRKCAKIHDEFGAQTMEILKDRPFELCSISGFGFKTVDAIAKKTGCSPDDPMRIGSALRFTLDEAMTSGHLYLDKAELRKQAHKLLNDGYQYEVVSIGLIHSVLSGMVKSRYLIHDDGTIYSAQNYYNEEEAADALIELQAEELVTVDVAKTLEESQKKLGITLAEKQNEAVWMCMNNSISIITGGPGTGKTTVLKVILDVYQALNPDSEIMLCAPTGRAARRMEESTGYPAQTIHKALGLVTEDSDFNETYDISADFVIVDEFSMVDMALAKELFTRIKAGTKILLVGDADQLPSVGAGNVFRELIKCGQIPVTRLDLVYRQSGASRIVVNAKLMQDGTTTLNYGEDFTLFECQSQENAAAVVCQMYLSEIAQHGIDRVQILSPFKNNGESSVKALNDRLRDVVNPPDDAKAEMKVGTRAFRVGDRVLQTKNTEEVSNGDVGFIRRISADEDGNYSAIIEFGDRVCNYSSEDMAAVELAYAMTIHKSQGSEYDTVIIPLLMAHFIMLQRNLLYTAITRAKKKVIIVGEKKAIYAAIRKNNIDSRNTKLAARIQRKKDETNE